MESTYDIHEADTEAYYRRSTGSTNFLPSFLAVEKSIWRACLNRSVHCGSYKTAGPLEFYTGTLMMSRCEVVRVLDFISQGAPPTASVKLEMLRNLRKRISIGREISVCPSSSVVSTSIKPSWSSSLKSRLIPPAVRATPALNENCQECNKIEGNKENSAVAAVADNGRRGLIVDGPSNSIATALNVTCFFRHAPNFLTNFGELVLVTPEPLKWSHSQCSCLVPKPKEMMAHQWNNNVAAMHCRVPLLIPSPAPINS
ncbi:hypothetical protein B0H11DRAFT_2210217 [Mycena galericulata]|nr:hypothetical protein B0H11DRAFT_2210217 [Mycena galericulata]